MDTLILGSRSPRRKEILGYFSLPFEQISSAFDEESIPFNGNPDEYVLEIAKGKALDLQKKFPAKRILTADTTVYCQGKIFGTPKTEEEAFETLTQLEGKWHEVYSGLALCHNGKCDQAVEMTRVFLNSLTDSEIQHYLSHKIWTDKAGGYAIQRGGGLIVRKIEGCFYNVMGFPINAVQKLLLKQNIDLWDYIIL